MRQTVSNHTFREALAGNLDLAKLPFEIARQIQAMQERLWRQQMRAVKREAKARGPHLQKRALARRLRQIEAGSLNVENGLCKVGAVLATKASVQNRRTL